MKWRYVAVSLLLMRVREVCRNRESKTEIKGKKGERQRRQTDRNKEREETDRDKREREENGTRIGTTSQQPLTEKNSRL